MERLKGLAGFGLVCLILFSPIVAMDGIAIVLNTAALEHRKLSQENTKLLGELESTQEAMLYWHDKYREVLDCVPEVPYASPCDPDL
jgi:hypothetical protein